MIKMLVGLGNPGTKYKNNRHNAGFIVMDELALKWGLIWELNKKLDSEVALATPRDNKIILYDQTIPYDKTTSQNKPILDDKVILLKPQTFMNDSGEAVARALAFFSIKPSHLLVVHDDVDLEPLQFKVSVNSSSAGHHGVQDIIDKIGTKDFTRLRIGIGRPKVTVDGKLKNAFNVEKYVLQDFTANQLSVLKKEGLEYLLSSLEL